MEFIFVIAFLYVIYAWGKSRIEDRVKNNIYYNEMMRQRVLEYFREYNRIDLAESVPKSIEFSDENLMNYRHLCSLMADRLKLTSDVPAAYVFAHVAMGQSQLQAMEDYEKHILSERAKRAQTAK